MLLDQPVLVGLGQLDDQIVQVGGDLLLVRDVNGVRLGLRQWSPAVSQ
jgi:hypothetical protein